MPQLVLILGTARLLSMVVRRLGQPPVIGEMTAGIVLGPIVFGVAAALADMSAWVMLAALFCSVPRYRAKAGCAPR